MLVICSEMVMRGQVVGVSYLRSVAPLSASYAGLEHAARYADEASAAADLEGARALDKTSGLGGWSRLTVIDEADAPALERQIARRLRARRPAPEPAGATTLGRLLASLDGDAAA
jgi:hypothetical protein